MPGSARGTYPSGAQHSGRILLPPALPLPSSPPLPRPSHFLSNPPRIYRYATQGGVRNNAAYSIGKLLSRQISAAELDMPETQSTRNAFAGSNRGSVTFTGALEMPLSQQEKLRVATLTTLDSLMVHRARQRWVAVTGNAPGSRRLAAAAACSLSLRRTAPRALPVL